MAIKELQTRIALKYDSYSAWTTAPGKDLVLLKGEIGICYVGDSNKDSHVVPTVLFKVGDGTKTFENLPWASAKAADVYSWAKSETVVLEGTTLKFKTGETVNHSIDLSSFATDAEVEAIRSGLDSRITAIENKFTGAGSVQGQIDALDGRLDVIEGEGEGSVKKALVDAKAYTDEREVEIKKYADQAEADAIAAAETASENKVKVERARITAVEGRLDAIEGEDGAIATGDAATLASAKSYADEKASAAETAAKGYTDTREAAIKLAYEAYADQSEADAKTYVDGEVDKLEAEDLRLAGLISGNTTAIGNEVTARENAISAINTKIGSVTEGKDVVTMISDAQSAAESNAATTAQGKVDALANGQVKTNTEAIATNASEISRVEGLVNTEKSRAEGIEADHLARIQKMEAFFEGAAEDSEGLNDALDKLVDIQNYLNGDGSATDGLLGQVAENAQAIENLEKEFAEGGRVTVAEKDIDNLEGRATALENADVIINGRIDALVGDNGTIASGDAITLASAKSYTDGRETLIRSELKTAYEAYADQAESDAVSTAKGYTDGEVAKLSAKDTELAGNITTLQNIVDGYSTAGSIKTAVDKAQEDATKGINDAKDAKDAADKAQGEIDALELVVGNETTGLAATKKIADQATSDIAALTTRVSDAEGDIDDLEAIVNDASKGNEKLRSDVNALQTLTGDSVKGNEALHTELSRVAGLVDNSTTGLAATKVIADRADAKSIANAGRLDTIESDYLKAADVYVFNCGSSTKVTHEQPAQA